MSHKRIVMAITGASGAPYAVRLLECLTLAGAEVHLVISPYGRRLLADETGITSIDAASLVGDRSELLTLYSHQDVGCRLASGSFLTEGMVICPCSSNTLGAIAAGLGDNLITRAATVTLKEARRLILVPRETPLSPIEIENMRTVSRAGGVICPASPGFYLKPQSVEDLVDFVVGKVLDLLSVPHFLVARWNSPAGAPECAAREPAR